MKTKMLRKTIAAIMALTIIGGAMPTGFTETIISARAITADMTSGSVTLSGDTLILNGEISKQQLAPFRENENIKNIVAMQGAILPEDCSYLFSKIHSHGYYYNGWNNVESIDLSNANTSNVKNMVCMFGDCFHLTSLNISGWDTSNVTDMTKLFSRCYRLTSLDVSGLDTSNVTKMVGMFNECHVLTSLDVSNFDTSKVENMSMMFSGCGSLTSLDLSNFDTSKVNHMSMMFSGCSSLTSLDLSNFDTSKVKGISRLFYNCNSLKTILVSSKWNTNNISLDWADSYEAFQNCSNLVGGNGTTYSSSHTNKEYARIDKGTSSPGYLTASFFNLRISHDINSKNNFGISYYIPAYLLEGYSNLKLKIQEEVVNADGTTSLVDRTTLSSGTETRPYGTEYVFRYNGIPAKKIGSNFYATLIAEKDGITYTSSADIYSIKKYANAKIKKDTVSAAMKELLVDMLNYGAAAQLYTNYNTTNLANSELTVAQQDYASKFNTLTLKSDYSNKNLNGAKAQIKKPTLLIGNTVSPRYSMTFNDTVNKNKVKLRIEYTDINGTKVTKNFAFDKFTELSNNPGTYQYDFSGLDAKNAFQSVTATLYENNTKISNTVTYSIPTFAYENANNSKKSLVLRNVTKAMMVYFNTAKNYTAWNSNSGLNT